MKLFLSRRRGFTLIELLLVIGIIAILASIVIIAINPTKQLGKARNAQRRSDVNTILNAVYQYAIDNNGNLPNGITTTKTMVCQDTQTNSGTKPCVWLRPLSKSGVYLVSIPKDPSLVDTTSTGAHYWIQKDTGGRITVSAPDAEGGETIQVTR